MDLGDIIFFGVVAITIIGNIVKAVRKGNREDAQRQKQPKPQEIETEPDWWTTYENKGIEETQKVAQPVRVVSKPVVFEEGISALKQDKAIPKEKKERIEMPEEKIEFDLSEVSEARKAVIYSEVFNRKY
ncbi:MAG: hypothetical protein LBR45_02185 [Bacteroidales bacterium]|jgi:hypothetical protein|nr:hypothetical protein [Bacteroidales bacterium]